MNGEYEKRLYVEYEKKVEKVKQYLKMIDSWLEKVGFKDKAPKEKRESAIFLTPECDLKIEDEQLRNTFKQYLQCLSRRKAEPKVPKEKVKKVISLATKYYSEIKKKRPDVVIIGGYHADECHSLIEGFLIFSCKPKYILMEYFGNKGEEEVEKIVEYIRNYVLRESGIIWGLFQVNEFYQSLPLGVLNELNLDTIIHSYGYATVLEATLLPPIICSADEVGAKIAGCDDSNIKHPYLYGNHTIDFISELAKMKRTKINEYIEGDKDKERECDLRKGETMANRILEYLNKVKKERREMIRNMIREMIRNYRVRVMEIIRRIREYRLPVIAIVGRDRANNVAQKLRERGVKVEVINLEPIEDNEEILNLKWKLYNSPYFIFPSLEELSSLYKKMYGKNVL